jgi:hypothetical protein
MAFSFLLTRGGAALPDYRIKNGKIVLSSGADAARDRIYMALNINLGEWYLDVDKGIPLYGENGILGGKRTEGEVGAIYRRAILRDPETERVVSLSIIQDSFRRVTVDGEAKLSLTNGTSETVPIEG